MIFFIYFLINLFVLTFILKWRSEDELILDILRQNCLRCKKTKYCKTCQDKWKILKNCYFWDSKIARFFNWSFLTWESNTLPFRKKLTHILFPGEIWRFASVLNYFRYQPFAENSQICWLCSSHFASKKRFQKYFQEKTRIE